MGRLVSSDAAEARELAELDAEDAAVDRVRQILERGGKGAYERAVAALPEDMQNAWASKLAEEPDDPSDDNEDGEQTTWSATVDDLREFLEIETEAIEEERRELHALDPAATAGQTAP